MFTAQIEWDCPDSFPDLSDAKYIAIDLETKDPDLKSKGSGAFTGGISTKQDMGYQKDAMRRFVSKSGLKIKGTTPIKINVNPDAAKTPTVKQSEVSKKAKEFTKRINKANINRKEFPGEKSGA